MTEHSEMKRRHREEDEAAMAAGVSPVEIGRRNSLIPPEVAKRVRILSGGKVDEGFTAEDIRRLRVGRVTMITRKSLRDALT